MLLKYSKGWLQDVFDCIKDIKKEYFDLDDIYIYESKLSEIHPNNHNIKAKIRQQLQLLRAENKIEFINNNGKYRIAENLIYLDSAHTDTCIDRTKVFMPFDLTFPISFYQDSPNFYKDFWTTLKIYVEKQSEFKELLPLYKPSNHNWYDVSFGFEKYHLVFRCSKQKQEISFVFYIVNEKNLFQELYRKKAHIERNYGQALNWENNENKKACTIKLSRNISSFKTCKECFQWLSTKGIKLFYLIHKEIDLIQNTFPDSADTDTCIEGAKTMVQVNKYERSYVARQKCIDVNGCYCHICGLNFKERYGEVGKDFIHVHHKIPLNEISEQYVVDPVNDLIPVCPNCHAMLHRKINNKYLSIEELKAIIKK